MTKQKSLNTYFKCFNSQNTPDSSFFSLLLFLKISPSYCYEHFNDGKINRKFTNSVAKGAPHVHACREKCIFSLLQSGFSVPKIAMIPSLGMGRGMMAVYLA